MNLIFFGSSHYSAEFLEKAVQNGLKVDLVVSRPPKPVGRKQILTENSTVTAAKKLGIPYIEKLKDLLCHCEESSTTGRRSNLNLTHKPQDEKKIASLSSVARNDNLIGLILDYNKIIPEEIIRLFPKGIINIHFSKLPQYRGPAPVQTAILNGDTQTAISYFLITEEVDAGPILQQTSLPVDQTETTESLYQKMIAKAAEEIVLVVANRLSDKDHPYQQQGSPTFTTKLTTETTKIDWQKSPAETDRLIRAAYPEPGAWTTVVECNTQYATRNTKRLKILKAHLEENKLVLDIVQLEGKNPVTWKQFQQGYPSFSLI